MERTQPTATMEDYLQALFVISREDGKPVVGARLAERLRVSHPTVVGMMRRMVRDGLVAMDEHKKIMLTDKGQEAAEGVMRRHCLAERFVTDILGMEWYKAHEEAHHIEHALSPEVEKRLAKVLGNPATCPHGNPIPGMGYRAAAGRMPLSQAGEGLTVIVENVSEEIEDNRELLEFLDRLQIIPGARLTVERVASFLGTITIRTNDDSATLGLGVASKVWVYPEAAAKKK